MDNEEQKQDPNAPQTGAVSPTGGGGGAVRLSPASAVPTVGGGGTSGSGGAPSGAPPTAAGGSFASLNKYIDANQGQATPLAGQLTNSIGGQYNNLDTQNNAAISSINNQVTNAPGYTASDPNVLAQEAANPVSFSGDQNNVKQFQSLLDNSYGGPVSAESTSDYANQQGAINNAIAAGTAATTTEAGRENLLSQNEATPTTGVTALNSAILSQDPNALSSVENAYKPFGNLLTNLSTGAQGVDTTIGKEQADATSSSQAANKAISDQINALNTGVTGELTTAQQNAAAQNAQIKSDLASGNLSATDLQALGMTADQWNSLSAADKAAATGQNVTSSGQGQFSATSGTTTIDPTQFLTQQDPNSVLNANNVATAQDYQKAQAFQTLLNGLNLGTPSTLINPSTASQAGTAPTNLNNYNYQTALNTAQATSAEEKAAAQAYVDAIQSGADENHAQLQAQNAAKNAAISTGASAVALGPAGSAVTGGAVGQYNALKNIISNPSLKTLENAPGTVLKGVEGGVQDAVNTISNIFCFHPDTQVEMADGSTKAIHKIDVGEETKGGKVLATTRGASTGFYWYMGVLVTGKHAVKEDGRWVRVENSKNGRSFKYLTEVVCNLTTDKHRIWANGVEFADERETDNYENLSLDASLDALNANV